MNARSLVLSLAWLVALSSCAKSPRRDDRGPTGPAGSDAAASPASRAPQLAGEGFQLFVLRPDWFDLHLSYAPEEALPILKAVDTSHPLFVIGLSEIETYDWSRQALTLTEDATQALAHAVAGAQAKEGPQALNDLKRSLGWGNELERALYLRAFVVKLRGEPLYGGIFLDATSQMAIGYPVVRVAAAGAKAVLSLLPVHVAFALTDPVDGSGTLREVQVPEEAKGDMKQLDEKDGFFTSWIQDMAFSEHAVEFRKLIRDARIEAILRAAGKLRD